MNRHAIAAVRGQLAAHPLTTGLHVAAAVADALRPGDQLVLGASNPVRDAALVGLNTDGIRVRSNRGVAGIDGTVSTAIGAALAYEGSRTVALIGDLTFVHDSSGLLIGPTEPTPQRLTIVVSNDNGGGIFELLEQGDPRFSDVSARIFGTPPDVDVGALCRAYHVEAGRSKSTSCKRRSTTRCAPVCGWKSAVAPRCDSYTPPSRPRADFAELCCACAFTDAAMTAKTRARECPGWSGSPF
jgi:2-succinyl-5-enolpyruvyl-6-hydroxy-3-cyclohexene-1-carboxylate synthase